MLYLFIRLQQAFAVRLVALRDALDDDPAPAGASDDGAATGACLGGVLAAIGAADSNLDLDAQLRCGGRWRTRSTIYLQSRAINFLEESACHDGHPRLSGGVAQASPPAQQRAAAVSSIRAPPGQALT